MTEPACTLSASMAAAFGEWFGLERTSTVVLVQLYRLGAEPATAAQLAVMSSSTPSAVVRHHLPRLRQALNAEAIDSEPARGYRLTDEGMAECRAVLWAMGEELRRAS